jgi:hypothetical protein
MFFSFPEDARWNAEWQAVEFGVAISEYQARPLSGSYLSWVDGDGR